MKFCSWMRRINVLVKRYKETRRSHPLAHGERVDKGIRARAHAN